MEMMLDKYYIGGYFLDCCPYHSCDKLKQKVTADVSSGLPQVSFI